MAEENAPLHYVGPIDKNKLRRLGFTVAAGENWISDSTINKIFRKHADLERIVWDKASLIDGINKLVKNAEYFQENLKHDDPSIKLYGEIQDVYVLLVIILREQRNSISTFHRFRKRKADQEN